MNAVRVILIICTVAITAAFPVFVGGIDPYSTDASASMLSGRGGLLALGADSSDNRSEGVVRAPAPPPPPDSASACVTAGQTGNVALSFNGGFTAVAVVSGSTFASDIRLTLRKVDPGSGPNALLADFVFELSAENCGGGGLGSLPSEVNLSVHYTDQTAAGRSPSSFAMVRLEGGSWTDAPKQATSTNYIASSTTALGVYAVIQR